MDTLALPAAFAVIGFGALIVRQARFIHDERTRNVLSKVTAVDAVTTIIMTVIGYASVLITSESTNMY